MPANSSFYPSSEDLFLLVPRLARNMADVAKRLLPQDNTTLSSASSSLLNRTASSVHQNVPSTAAPLAAAATPHTPSTGFMSYLTMPFSADGIKGFGGMFAYIGSRWALATFAIVRPPQSLVSVPY